MADQFIQVPPQSTGLKIDCTELTVGANTVERERQNIADPTDAAGLAKVINTAPTTEYGLVVRNIPSGTQAVSGTFFQATQPVSGTVTANIGTTNGLALDATLTGGSAVSIIKGGAKGTTTAAVLTSNPVDANTQALHVDGSKVTQPVSGTVSVTNFANPLPVSQSGTWTVQPGNTPNTTAWKVDGSAVTQPVSLTSTTITGTISTKTDLTPASPTAATVGVTSAQVVATNSNRKGLVLINTSSNTISLGFGATAVLNSGITLSPFGVFQMDETVFDTGAVNAIASAASSNLAIQEYST